MRIGRLKIAKREMIFDNMEIFAKTSENASLVANVGGHLAFCSGTATQSKYYHTQLDSVDQYGDLLT